MFPDNIESKITWDKIQNEFGSTERLIVAFGDEKKSILDNEKAHSDLLNFTKKVEELEIVDYVTTINNFLAKDDEKQFFTKKTFKDYSKHKKESFLSTDDKFISIFITPKVQENNTILVSQVKEIVKENLNDYKIHYAGQPFLTGETPRIISKDVKYLLLIGIIIMFTILQLNLRSFYCVSVVLLSVVMCLLGTVGFMGWMFKITGYEIFNFTLLSTSMPIILLTIANSDGVHIVGRFRQYLIKTKKIDLSINKTVSILKKPIFMTSITTAIAFLAMVFSPIPHLRGYGIVISFGIMLACLISIILIPSLLMLKKWDLESKYFFNKSIIEKQIEILKNRLSHNYKRKLVIYSSILSIAIVGILFLKVEVNVIKFFKKGSTIRQSSDFVDEKMSGTMNFTINVTGDFTQSKSFIQLENFKNQISNIDNVSEIKKIYALSDYLSILCREFLDINSNPDSDDLDFCFTAGGIHTDLKFKNERLDNIINKEKNSTLISGFIETISTDRASEIADKIDNEIKKFKLDSNVDQTFQTTGLLFFLGDFVSLVVQSSIISIIVSIFAIMFVAWLYFKKFVWAILSIIPLLTAIILNFGIMGLLGIELSHLTALLISIIIGVGVDFSIHYISDYIDKSKQGVTKEKINIQTFSDVGYPIFLDVISNLGFIVLVFSAIVPLNYMGILMVFAMLSTSFGTLFILSSIVNFLTTKTTYLES